VPLGVELGPHLTILSVPRPTLLLTLCGLTSQKTNQGGLGLSGTVHEEAYPCFPNFVERPFVKRFALCYRSVGCPVCLSVCNVCALWPNVWTDQDETWHAGTPRHWPHCVRWGPSSPSRKGAQPPPIFGPYLLRPNGCVDQDVTWY